MEPRIQYAKTSDSVSIAYWTLGEGMPLVDPPGNAFGHAQMEWQIPTIRRWYEHLAQQRMLVRYDGRGTGLSDRSPADFSLDSQVLDLKAVVNRLGLTKFALLGIGDSGPATIAYAARHPEQISRLVLLCTYACGSQYRESPKLRGLGGLLTRNWELYTETLSQVLVDWEGGHEAHRFAALMRESTTPEAFQSATMQIRQFDVSDLLPQVKCPTLVLHRRQLATLGVDVARDLASRIPEARFVLLEGSSMLGGDVAAVIEEFLSQGEQHPPVLPSGTAVILFADIADSTALTERLGDTAFREKARDLDAALRAIIRDNAGTPIEGKLLGDGVLAVFTSARQAIEAAAACGRAGDDGGLPLHLGLHAGDVIREDNNVYGGAVNIASRISGLSAPGEVLVSETVRSLARTSSGVTFEDRGEQLLKGVGEPVRVWAVVDGE